MKKKEYLTVCKKAYEDAKELLESGNEDSRMSKLAFLNRNIQNDIDQLESTLNVCAILAVAEENLKQ